MPLFVVTCTDNEGTVEKRLAVRPQHLARLEKLDAEGRLIAAGAMPKDPANPQAGFYGSTIIADFDSREALDAWLDVTGIITGPIFRRIRKGDQLGEGLSPAAVRTIAWTTARRFGRISSYCTATRTVTLRTPTTARAC